MNSLIHQSETNYEQMLFKEALRTTFFEMQSSRDKYRELVGGETNMNSELVMIFVELQVILLSPICPHITEYIWRTVLNKVRMNEILINTSNVLPNLKLALQFRTNLGFPNSFSIFLDRECDQGGLANSPNSK